MAIFEDSDIGQTHKEYNDRCLMFKVTHPSTLLPHNSGENPCQWFQVVGNNITACLKDLDRFGYSERIEKDAQVRRNKNLTTWER